MSIHEDLSTEEVLLSTRVSIEHCRRLVLDIPNTELEINKNKNNNDVICLSGGDITMVTDIIKVIQ